MRAALLRWRWLTLAATVLMASGAVFAQTAPAPTAATKPTTPSAPPAAATPAATSTAAATGATATPAPPSPVGGIRNKLAAGDLLSAESVLEVHREKYGEDGAWLAGLGWLARGALLVGDLDKAGHYAADARARCTERLAKGAVLAQDHDIEGALGCSIEVEAQLRERAHGRNPAARYVRDELATWSAGSTAFRSRLHKRLNQLTLVGSPAPELVVEDRLGAGAGEAPPTLAALRGKPVLLFLWAEWCGDCKAQSASLARVLQHHQADGLRCIAVTRYYDDGDSARAVEKLRADSVWTAVYSGVGQIPRVLSTASMVTYGVSATPTFAFVDRKGIVRRYTPTRLTEPELERGVTAILK
jgi:cytochrome c biogenesis protein CcmG/thiol:disulfide interchange protein DsbE